MKPEMEVFEPGHLWFAKQMLKEGLIDCPADVPALPRHSVGRAGRHQHHEELMASIRCRQAPSGPVSASAACRCRWWPRPCCLAATAASGSRTTLARQGRVRALESDAWSHRAVEHHPRSRRPRADAGGEPQEAGLEGPQVTDGNVNPWGTVRADGRRRRHRRDRQRLGRALSRARSRGGRLGSRQGRAGADARPRRQRLAGADAGRLEAGRDAGPAQASSRPSRRRRARPISSRKAHPTASQAQAVQPDRRACAARRADRVLDSSGLLPTDIQRECKHPERPLIGHPFNPVYLLPLVELIGGKKTAPETITRAADFYRSIGMHPLMVPQGDRGLRRRPAAGSDLARSAAPRQ